VADAIWRGATRTRREAIKQGLALVGAAGAGALLFDPTAAGAATNGGTGQNDDSGDGSGNATGDGGQGGGSGSPQATFSFAGTGFDLSGPGYASGTLPDAGQHLIIAGDLLDPSGAAVGQLFGTYVQLVPFGQAGPADPVSVLDEVLSLAGGTVCGRGLGLGDLDAPISFAITGGTGQYAGLSGTYSAAQHFLSLGGDGTAQFTFTTTGEAPNHGS